MTTPRTTKIRNRAGAVGAATLLGIAALTVPAIAQDAEDDATTEESAPDDEQDDARAERRAVREEAREARETDFVERLAVELGLEVEAVDTAVTSVRDEMVAEATAERLAELETRLDERVAAGDLTQEEADEILQGAEDGELPRRGHHGRRGAGPGGRGGDEPAGDAAAHETA